MKSNEKSAGSQSGFTLVEVMVAMVVLTVGLLTIAAVFAQGVRIITQTPMQLAAKELANEIIDDLTVRRDAGILGAMATGTFEEIVVRDCNEDRPELRDCKFFHTLTEVRMDPTGAFRVEVTVTYWADDFVTRDPTAANARRYTTTTIIN
jgi:type IV pilus assembly protein PilV